MNPNMLLNHKVLFYLSTILALSVIPVYLYRRSWKEVLAVASAIICFFIINSNFFTGVRSLYGATHDTLCSYENLLNILKQWLDAGISIGWNPYMNGGEPFYLFSNLLLWAPWVIFCWINRFINISPHLLFNCFWIFIFINFCLGGFLLFSLIYDNFKAAFLTFITLMFSGMFIANLIQPASITVMYYFPYIIFVIISSFKNKNIYGVCLGIIFFGILANHYLPIYLFLCLAFFIILAFCFNLIALESLSSLYKQILEKYKVVLCALFLSVLAASPALFTYSKMQGFVSPTRGDTVGGVIKANNPGAQRAAFASLDKYNMFFTAKLEGGHHSFYFGIIPLLMVFFAIAFSKKKVQWVFLISAVLIAYVAIGVDSELFCFLTKYIPGCYMIRHTFALSQFVAFFLICCAGYGFKYIFSAPQNIFRTPRAKYWVFIFLTIVTFFSQKPLMIILCQLFLILIFAINSKDVFFEKQFLTKNFALMVLLLMSMDVLCNYSLLPNRTYRVYDYFADFNYPTTRTLYPLQSVSKIDLVNWCRSRKYGANPDTLYQELLKNKILIQDESNPDYAYVRDDIKSEPILSQAISRAGIRPYVGKFIWRVSSYPLPLDISSLIHKKASLTHPHVSSVFFRSIRLSYMLNFFVPDKNYGRAFGENSPIIYFSSNVKVFPDKTPKTQVIKSIYDDAISNVSLAKRSVFFLEKDVDFGIVNNNKNSAIGKIEYTDRNNPNRVDFLVDSYAEGFLVRLENYNSDWSAYVDGIETNIYKANYAFQAIKIPKGKHKVSFRFSSIYPVLFYSHVVVVVVCWFLFALYLRFCFELKEVNVRETLVIE